MNPNTAKYSRQAYQQRGAQLPALSGKVPPHDADLEQVVLGAMILEREGLITGLSLLQPEVFFIERHQQIFRAMHYLHESGSAVDLLLVKQRLRTTGELDRMGGAFYLAELTNMVASAANTERHCRILLESYMKRQLITICSTALQDLYAQGHNINDAFDLADAISQQAVDLIGQVTQGKSTTVANVFTDLMASLQVKATNGGGITGIPSGFRNIDARFGGWQPGKLYIIAARPSMGKTAFAIEMLKNAALRFGKKVALFSLEMGNDEMLSRMLASECQVKGEALTKATLTADDWRSINSKSSKLINAPIYLDDTGGLDIKAFKAKVRRLVHNEGVELVMLDYLQLMSAGEDTHNREQTISTISRTLKLVARELEIPVIALSQLSRSVETRGGDKRPLLSDLRESGSIEQDADAVMFLFRPEYYNQFHDDAGRSTKGMVEIITRKWRAGELGTDLLHFDAAYFKFSEKYSYTPSAGEMHASVTIERNFNANEEAPF